MGCPTLLSYTLWFTEANLLKRVHTRALDAESSPLVGMSFILMGASISSIVKGYRNAHVDWSMLTCASSLLLILSGFWFKFAPLLLRAVQLPSMAVLIVALPRDTSCIRYFFENGLLCNIGKVSWPLYLWHLPLALLFLQDHKSFFAEFAGAVGSFVTIMMLVRAGNELVMQSSMQWHSCRSSSDKRLM